MANVNFDSPSVQSYLTILQSVIARMASNSANCKTWCVTLVSAILVVVADKSKPNFVWIAAIPVLLFFLLDSYYLALERLFRDRYNGFIKKLHESTASIEDVFIVTATNSVRQLLWSLMMSSVSISVAPFYVVLLLTITAAWSLIL